MNICTDGPEHPCYWCGETCRTWFWACNRCSILKEEGHERAREQKAKNGGEVLNHVWDVMEEHGVKPVMPIA